NSGTLEYVDIEVGADLAEILQQFKVWSNDIDMIPASTQFKGIIDDLYTQYYPLSHRLRHWEYLIEFREEGGSVIHTILAFAIACPNFVSVFVPSIIRKDLELDLKEVVESGLYSEHVDKIQRLLRSV
ncbi:hypothetical protein LPJ81_004837, partial [Coemansia sp. IMI 209127]